MSCCDSDGTTIQQLPCPASLHDYHDTSKLHNLNFPPTQQHQSLDECSSCLQQWDGFNVFSVASLTGGRPLQYVALAVIDHYGLVERLSLSRDRLTVFLEKLEGSYYKLPYHQSTHAADVVQALGVSMKLDGWSGVLDDVDMLAVIIAAAMHDVGHPGVNNSFHCKAKTEAEVMYQGTSVNEQMHIAYGMHLLHEVDSCFISHLTKEQQIRFRRVIIRVILATDMASHIKTLEKFEMCVKEHSSDVSSWPEEERLIALQMALHCADISSPARPRPLSCIWGLRVQEEFCRQGDLETIMGLPVVQLCDRGCTTAQQNQMEFISNSLVPALQLFHAIAPRFVGTTLPLARQSLEYWSLLLPK